MGSPSFWRQIKNKRQRIFDNWLDRRIPTSSTLVLNHQRIFILPTQQGFYFVLVMLALFVGGINYKNSLVLGMNFLLASLFMVSILHTFRNLSGVCIQAGHTEDSFAGDYATFHVTLSRHGQRIYEAISLKWEDSVPQIVDLIDETEQTARLLLPVKKRGVYKPGRLYIETKYPIGLFRAWSWVDLGSSCLVYPQPLKSQLPIRNNLSKDCGDVAVHEGNDDFEGLRKYVTGDPLRQIAWKAYARGQGLHTKSFVGQADQTIWLNFEGMFAGSVEERLSQLCYQVLKLSEKNQTFGLRMPNQEISAGYGHGHKIKCLEALALYGSS